jgi:hypothetical protein
MLGIHCLKTRAIPANKAELNKPFPLIMLL